MGRAEIEQMAAQKLAEYEKKAKQIVLKKYQKRKDIVTLQQNVETEGEDDQDEPVDLHHKVNEFEMSVVDEDEGDSSLIQEETGQVLSADDFEEWDSKWIFKQIKL